MNHLYKELTAKIRPASLNSRTLDIVIMKSIESSLIALAERVKLKAKTALMFREYVDHGEYGLALDEVGVAMFAAGRSPSEDDIARFRDIVELMNGNSEEYLALAKERAQYPD